MGLIGTIQSVISVVIVKVFQVLFEAQFDVAGVSQTNKIMEEIEVVFVTVVGAFQELNRRMVQPRRRVIALWIVVVVIPPGRPRQIIYGPTTCRPAVFYDGIM